MEIFKNLKILIIIGICLAFSTSAQNTYWMQKAGGLTPDEGYDISIDASGNTYTTGYFSGSSTFGTTTLNSSGLDDIFITKLNNSGNYEWAIKAGGSGSDRGQSIKADGNGNIYITGYFYGTATFGSQTITSAGIQDVYIAKYNNAGTLLWVKIAGGPDADIGYGINIDNNGNAFVTGQFLGTALFGSTTLTSMNNSIDVFTTKLDASGNFIWAKKGSAPNIDKGTDLACDNAGNVYVTGQFTDTITFDATHNNNMYNAIFIIKYNSTGQEQWFRKIGGGTLNIANGIAVDINNNIYLTGDFTGNIIFFGSTNTTLSNTYTNRIFVAKYNSAGDLAWAQSDGSTSELTSRNLAVDSFGNAYIVGNFKCRLNEYADAYGQGTFNSVGYWDIFVAKYNSIGAWQWSRQSGGRKDDYGYGIAVNNSGAAYITGSFNDNINFPVSTDYIGYNSIHINIASGAYCNDNSYFNYEAFLTTGSEDIIIAKNFDPAREPYDYYNRPGGAFCSRPVVSSCILTEKNFSCADSVAFCVQDYLFAVSNTSPDVGPKFIDSWSNGESSQITYVDSTGYYYIVQTSEDGCFVSTDSIYVTIHPNPPKPTISDSKGININATETKGIVLCMDSVLLTGGNYGTNTTYGWMDTNNNIDSLWVTTTPPNSFVFKVTNSFGCFDTNKVFVKIEYPLPPIIPKLICVQDTDRNDTITICSGSPVVMSVFDSIANPNGLTQCLDGLTVWSVTPATELFDTIVACNFITTSNGVFFGSINGFVPTQSGSYTFDVMVFYTNECDIDTYYVNKSIYIDLNGNTGLSISGTPKICPGDSTLLVAGGATSYAWYSNNLFPNYWYGNNILVSTSDSVWISDEDYYALVSTNSLGCSETLFVNTILKPQPAITMNPSIGLICPNDSVNLISSGTGSFAWQGPSGPEGGNAANICVNVPGTYYTVRTDSDNCALISNSVLVNQYATPFLLATPSSFICNDDTVTISVITNESSVIEWQPPLAGSNPVQLITVPGIYSCKITSCGITTITNITISKSIVAADISVNGPLTFCMGDSVTLTSGSTNENYLWQPGSFTGPAYTVYQSGDYTLLASDANGCSILSDTITVTVGANNLVDPLVRDTSICKENQVALTALAQGNIQWYKTASGGNSIATGAVFTTPVLYSSTVYYVSASDSGCKTDRIPLSVEVENCDSIFIPNVFTPNGDGPNDDFHFYIKRSTCFHAEIYNRWGTILYEWDDVNAGWDGTIIQSGKKASDGVYYYMMYYCDYLTGRKKTHAGFVHLLGNRE